MLCVALLTGLTACNDDNPWQYSEGEGGIIAKVTADANVRDAIPTRAQALAPDVSEFGLKLTKNDGTLSKEWNKVADFEEGQSFRSGTYTLEAYYGDIEEEGYNKPYYHGSAMINVRPGETTEAAVTAQLANTMVDVQYTDAFINYFSDYSTTLHSEGHGHHEIAKSVSDPLYLAPGEVTVTVAFTKQNGQSATIQPAQFKAEPRHFYHITLDVNNGQVGDAVLVVKFDDTVQTEDVEVDLSDELLNIPGPEVTPAGFTDGQNLVWLNGTQMTDAAKFNIFAPGKISSAVLTINSDTYNAPFGREIELANADDALQQQLAAAGIKAVGLFKNPNQMAYVDIAGLIGNLPEGNHSISLVVKDPLTRVSEPITLNVTSMPLEISLVSTQTAAFGSTTGNITVAYNGPDIAKNIKIKGLDDHGVWVDCPIVTAAAAAPRRAAATRSDLFPTKNYNLTLKIPNTSRNLDIKLYLNGKEVAKGTINREMPDYSLSSNDFATRTIIKVSGQTGSMLSTVTSQLRLFAGGSEIPAQNVTRNPSTGEITVIGLKPGTEYHITSTLQAGANPLMGAEHYLTTEAAAQPENGAMENWYSQKAPHSQTFGFGADAIRWFANANGSSYWATRNITTTSVNSGPTPNYVSFSGTYSVDHDGGKAAQICTVGWGEGSTFVVVGNGGICKNSTAGMLFMGTHNYTGSTDFDAALETFNYGQPFTSRPSSFSFDYTFASFNGESFKAYAVIENRNGGKVTELARGELTSATDVSNYTKATVNLKYSNTALKATHAYIVFISSTSPNPGEKNVQGSKGAFEGYVDARRIGNVLTVDNIQFNY